MLSLSARVLAVLFICTLSVSILFLNLVGAQGAHCFKRSPANLAVLGSRPTMKQKMFPTVNKALLHTGFHKQPPIALI